MCFSKKSESWISLSVGCSASRSEVALASSVPVPPSSSSPVQASLRGHIQARSRLKGLCLPCFPTSKPFSIWQLEWFFKNTCMSLSLLHLTCFPLCLDPHHDLQGLTCQAPVLLRRHHFLSLHPSSWLFCQTGLFCLLMPLEFPPHLEGWFSLSSAPHPLASSASGSMSSPWSPNLNLLHSTPSPIFNVLCSFSLSSPWHNCTEMIVCIGVWEWPSPSSLDARTVRTLSWGPHSASLVIMTKWMYIHPPVPSGFIWLTSIVSQTEWELAQLLLLIGNNHALIWGCFRVLYLRRPVGERISNRWLFQRLYLLTCSVIPLRLYSRILRQFRFGKLPPLAIVVIITFQTTALAGWSWIKNGQELASRILPPFRTICNRAKGCD